MGILDEAIKEHLELKRQHGAGESELKKLEDEAFGPPERPGVEAGDAVAEAPTEFMAQPEPAEDLPPRRRAPDIADLQEAPQPELEVPAEEQAAADEVQPAGPSTEERQALAEEPTQLYDVEGEIEESESPAPSEEQLVEAEMGEPRLAPVDPLADAEDEEEEEEPEPAAKSEEPGEEEDDDFWDEKRLSDELDQALEAPEEDLLEETPDFLEEAPEDDQLWFEQKPPKDFDFDD
ncbi:MAG TPA: hypothetical protein VFP23_00835 [Solirubrobacterales bacterium]|nr:hypothetical protein [Solirubrobacterales bacterium]